MPRKPHEFPKGSSETSDTFTRLLFDLPYGEYRDVGLADYGEFITSLDYGWDLLHRETVRLDGIPGRVSVIHRFLNGVQLQWRSLAGELPKSKNACRWGDMEDAA